MSVESVNWVTSSKSNRANRVHPLARDDNPAVKRKTWKITFQVSNKPISLFSV